MKLKKVNHSNYGKLILTKRVDNKILSVLKLKSAVLTSEIKGAQFWNEIF